MISMERIVSVKKKKFSYDVMTLRIYCVIYSLVHPLAIQQLHGYDFRRMCVLFHFSRCKRLHAVELFTRVHTHRLSLSLRFCTATVLCSALLFSHQSDVTAIWPLMQSHSFRLSNHICIRT